jgi:hypothetical protein
MTDYGRLFLLPPICARSPVVGCRFLSSAAPHRAGTILRTPRRPFAAAVDPLSKATGSLYEMSVAATVWSTHSEEVMPIYPILDSDPEAG